MTVGEYADVRSVADRLLAAPVATIERVLGGGNNELFRISAGRERYALKRYVATVGDTRDRIGYELGALTFLSEVGETAVPQPIAADRDERIAIYEWIEGTPVESLGPPEIETALAFLARLHAYRWHASAAGLPAAVEACTSADALRAQVRARLDRLNALGRTEPLLAAYLETEFVPALQLMETRGAGESALPQTQQTLSPSDFGRHNMLRRDDGRLVFLDFEYFGWDDPVKLVADIIWHPGSALGLDEREQVAAGARAIFADDPGYAERFARRAPVFGLRWALIVLSEFDPERWARRRRAGEAGDWEAVKRRQLAKAREITHRSVVAWRARDD